MDNTKTLTDPITFEIPIKCIDPAGMEPSVTAVPSPEGPKSYRNIEMDQMLAQLAPFLDRTDKIGYAAARNTRILRFETEEYFERRRQLIMEYGQPRIGEDGDPTGETELRFDSPEFAEYAAAIEEWANIRHAPNLFTLPVSEVIGKLSGSEILGIEWMLDWDA